MTTFFSILLVLLGIVLIFVILLQRGRGGGLVGAFGAGGGGSAFGTKTGDVFTTITVVLFVLFMFLAIGLNWMVQGSATVAASRPAATSQTGMPGVKTTAKPAPSKIKTVTAVKPTPAAVKPIAPTGQASTGKHP